MSIEVYVLVMICRVRLYFYADVTLMRTLFVYTIKIFEEKSLFVVVEIYEIRG